MTRITPLKILLLAFLLAALVVPAAATAANGNAVNGSISGHVATVHNVTMSQIQVYLVNASNMSEDIPGFVTVPDSDGYFQFKDVPNGTYKAFAWGPYLAAGMTNDINVTENVTYVCAIVMKPEPYYGNMTVTQNPIPLEGAKTDIIVTVYDFWENPVGPGISITMHTTAGWLDPLYGETDASSQFRTTLTSPDTGSYAEVQEFARGWNGSFYPLQKRVQVVTATPTPSPAATAQPSPTVTPLPTVTVLPSATPGPTATPVPSATPKPTPGFELAFVLAAIGGAAIALRRK